jgi:hypothetical protein
VWLQLVLEAQATEQPELVAVAALLQKLSPQRLFHM